MVILYTITFFTLFITFRRQGFQQITLFLQNIKTQSQSSLILADNFIWPKEPKQCEFAKALFELVLDNIKKGLPSTPAVEILQRQIAAVKKFFINYQRLYLTIYLRALVAVTAAFFSRSLLLSWHADPFDFLLNYDLICLTLALLIIGIALFFLQSILRAHWFWDKGLTKIARSWLKTIFTLKPEKKLEFYQTLKSIELEELSKGVSLGSEKYQLLEEYCQVMNQKHCDKFDQLEDFFSLFELVVIGVPVTLILLCPCLSLVF